jgi:hypothetical protein
VRVVAIVAASAPQYLAAGHADAIKIASFLHPGRPHYYTIVAAPQAAGNGRWRAICVIFRTRGCEISQKFQLSAIGSWLLVSKNLTNIFLTFSRRRNTDPV